MTELQVLVSLKSLSSDISGILGSDEASLFFNMMIEDQLPQMIDTYSIDIGQVVCEYFTPIANNFLHNLTLSDIIGGGHGNDKPCTV